jgi:flavin-dependent dehydrogenase
MNDGEGRLSGFWVRNTSEGKGDMDYKVLFSEHFYAFFKVEITSTYAYVIPKDGFLVLGAGFRRSSFKQAHTCMQRFRAWLCREFSFEPISLVRVEAAPIPYGISVCGKGRTILVGDAAGFCNHFSGEGIRLAIESGVLAAECIGMVKNSGRKLSTIYRQHVGELIDFVQKVHEFATHLTDEKMERFVETKLKRISLS